MSRKKKNEPPDEATSERNPIAVLNRESSIFNVEWLSFQTFTEIDKSFLLFDPDPRDVVLASYVKCDNRVIEIILWKLLRANLRLPAINDITNRYLQTYETVGLREASQPPFMRPKLVKTHLPYQMVPHNSRTKYIYLVRKPWDVVSSCYKSVVNFADYDGSFEEFFNRFVEGKLGYGNYFIHVASWQKHRHLEDNDFLLLPYEVVKSEPRSTLFNIAAFLGDNYLEFLLTHDDYVQNILKTIECDHQVSRTRHSKTSRKCSTKHSLNREQLFMMIDCTEEHLKKTGVEDLWKAMLRKSTTLSAAREEMDSRNETLSNII